MNGSQAAQAIQKNGYVILERLLHEDDLARIRRELSPHFTGRLGRNDFEGERTERVYALLAKAPSIAKIIEHPLLLGVMDHFLNGGFLLWAALAIRLHPGETRQEFHMDDEACMMPRPRAPMGLSVMWAIDDFTTENGATEFIPGSHTWSESERATPDDPRITKAVMPSGSALVWAGNLFHRGGANDSTEPRLGITIQYSQPWLRQVENMVLAVPPECAAQYSTRIQELLGYSLLEGTFMGYVDGRHPRKLIPNRPRAPGNTSETG